MRIFISYTKQYTSNDLKMFPVALVTHTVFTFYILKYGGGYNTCIRRHLIQHESKNIRQTSLLKSYTT